MSRITKCICDGCGKEIEKDPIKIFAETVDVETGNHMTNPEDHFYHDGKDYCRNCVQQIVYFINGLPARNAGKPAVPNPEFEEAFKELRSVTDTAKAENKQEQRKPTVRELIEAGKTTDEIVQATGCLRKSVGQIRYQMAKKKQAEEAARDEKEPEESRAPSAPEHGAEDSKTVKCSEVGKTCEYAGKAGLIKICDYTTIVGHSRGCPAEACTVYKKRGQK